MDGAINYTLNKPVGVAGLITPWNLPLLAYLESGAGLGDGQYYRGQALRGNAHDRCAFGGCFS